MQPKNLDLSQGLIFPLKWTKSTPRPSVKLLNERVQGRRGVGNETIFLEHISSRCCHVFSFPLNQRSMTGELNFPSAEECDSNVTPTRHVTVPVTFIDVMQYRQVFKSALRGRCLTLCGQLFIQRPFENHGFFLCRKTLSRDAIVFIRGDSMGSRCPRFFFFFFNWK